MSGTLTGSCAGFGAGSPRTIADGLRAIDCDSAAAIEGAFGRFFGPSGALGTALTILLTLYVAFIAIRMLTGRGGLSLGGLTPRMLTLGLILTFATSWIAYQAVVLNLALGAPDEVARLLIGSKGSATILFADRLDTIFDAIASAAGQALPPQMGPTTAPPPATASDLLWLAALMLLLGTVGILLVARIALAAMLVLGPIFIVLALFGGTRGLFEGWLKAVALFALTPLFAVLLGSGTIALIGPMVDDLARGGAEPEMRVAVTIFLGASVHIALMFMALKAATTIVIGWRIPWLQDDRSAHSGGFDRSTSANDSRASAVAASMEVRPVTGSGNDRVQALVAGLSRSMAMPMPDGMTGEPDRTRIVTAQSMPVMATPDPRTGNADRTDQRTRGLGDTRAVGAGTGVRQERIYS
jgi:type IV secretion system protein VirB6